MVADFTAASTGGKTIRLEELRGQNFDLISDPDEVLDLVKGLTK